MDGLIAMHTPHSDVRDRSEFITRGWSFPREGVFIFYLPRGMKTPPLVVNSDQSLRKIHTS